jgi:putative serine protease PepD
LVDCVGRLVGVNTAIATVPGASGQGGGGNVGIGFAIPVDLAIRVAEQLIATGRLTPAYFGAETAPLTPAAARQRDLDGGLAVLVVTPEGPAAGAGLRRGDVITAVDGRATMTPDALWLISVGKAPGDSVSVEYNRDGRSRTTTVELSSQHG